MAGAAERVAARLADWTERTAANAKIGVDEARAADRRAQARLSSAGQAGPLSGPAGGDALLSRAAAGAGGKRLPMTAEQVEQIAQKYGIDISDVNVRVDKSRTGFYGSTAPNGTVTLTRSAFVNEEQLARTLAHERYHVDQIRGGMGYPKDYDSGNAWETAAQEHEDNWWASTGSGLQ
jgi:hypothetical protein